MVLNCKAYNMSNPSKTYPATSRSFAAEYLTFIATDGELEETTVIRDFRTTAKDGKHKEAV